MKFNISYLGLLVFWSSFLTVSGQSQDQNYIKTTEMLEPVNISTLNNNYEAVQKLETVTYFDGFGKAKQSIGVRQSPSKKDVVQHMEYDQYGRSVKQYLPLPSSQNSGNYISNAGAQIGTYYQNAFADQHPFAEVRFENSPLNRQLEKSAVGDTWQLLASSDADHTTKYSYGVNASAEVFRVELDDSNPQNPLQLTYYVPEALTKSITKNENWTPSDGLINTQEEFVDKNGRKIVSVFYEEVSGEVKKRSTYYVYDDLGNLRYVIPPKLSQTFEPPGLSLQYNDYSASWPVNDFLQQGSAGTALVNFRILNNVLTLKCKDLGLSLPNKILNAQTTKILATFPGLPDMTLGPIQGQSGLIDINGNPAIVTYGQASIVNGNLVFTRTVNQTFSNMYLNITVNLSTNAGLNTVSQEALDDLAFQYKYDAYNRQIEQKVPGKGWEYMVYDQLDRPILTQDANLRADNKWLFNKYDVFGRVVYSGKYTNSASRSALQTQVDNFINLGSNKANIVSRTTGTNNIGGALINYSNNAFPNTNQETLTVSYYDDYNFTDSDRPALPTHILGQEVTTKTKGLLTATWFKTLGSTTWTKKYTYYDHKGRVIYVYDKNHLGGNTQNKSKVDFRGKVVQSITQHKRLNGSTELSIADRFDFDHAERPLNHYQQINGQEEELIAQNSYNERGQLEQKIIGGLPGASSANKFMDIVQLDVTGDIITKTHNSTSWNAGLATKGQFTGDGYVQFEAVENQRLMVGLSTDNSSAGYNTIDYAIYLTQSVGATAGTRRIYIYEAGSNKGWKGDYIGGDILSVERIGNSVQYKKNGVTFYTSLTLSSGTLLGDVSICNYNHKIKHLEVSSGYTDLVNMGTATIASTTQELKKVAGANTWDAGLATVNTIKANENGKLTYKIGQTNKYIMVGLSDTNTNAHYNTIDYAIYTLNNGTVRVYESGSNKGSFGTYQAHDEFTVERIDGTVYYKKNGVVFYQSTVPSNTLLVGDSSFHTVGGKIYDLQVENLESGLQTIDYAYNIRGWMTDLNDVNNLGNDVFGYHLKYDEALEGNASVSNIYNGHIKQVIWKSAHNNLKKSYAFEYDDLNRFHTSHYRENNSLTAGDGKFETYGVGYDENGNIKVLRRNNQLGSQMDKLGYTYDDGNKLMSIYDMTANASGFKDGVGTIGNDYYYDLNGNLIKDQNKGITSIQYNHLDLVENVTFNNGHKIEFTYASDGTKLQMKTIVGSTPATTTDYLGGFQYANSQLQYFPTPEGYAAPDGPDFKYVYIIRDHLGNNRLSFSDVNNDGAIHTGSEILSSTDHYVMGLTHHGEYIAGLGSNYNFKYQGKEQLGFNGYNMYDFGSRMYDASVGRWFNTDPQNQFASPYIALGNNWVMMVDQNGEIAWVPVIIGAVLGAYSAGTIANNGELNPFKWKWDLKTFGYVLGGAVVGGVSAGLGAAVAQGGGVFANTMGMVSGSFVNSVGMAMLTGQNNVTVNFGVASYNLSNGDVGYLGERGNKFMENFGFAMGLIQNLNDIMVGFKKADIGEVELVTEHSDEIGHSALVEPGTANEHSSIVSFGPDGRFSLNPFVSDKGTNAYWNHTDDGSPIWRTTIKGINKAKVLRYGTNLSKNTPKYNVYFSSCVTHTSSALMRSGFINIGVHPYILAAQVYLRDIGVRSIYFNHYFTNNFYDEGN